MNNYLDEETNKYYSSNAQQLADKYQTLNETAGVSKYFDNAFYEKSKILDLGCGSGRDLQILINKGFLADGLDCCLEFCNYIREKYPSISNSVFFDSLPYLITVKDNSYDGILCSAVLMHIPEEYLFDCLFNIRRVLKKSGRLLISIPEDDSFKENRDEFKRFYNCISPDKFKFLFERIGFKLISRWKDNDTFDRKNRIWHTLLFSLDCVDGIRSIDQIESILNRDKKTATYKLALIRALAEIAITNYNLAVWNFNSQVELDLNLVVEKWIKYYWPIFNSEEFIPQMRGEMKLGDKGIGFRKNFRDIISQYKTSGGLNSFLDYYKTNSHHPKKEVKDLFKEIAKRIKDGPIKHTGGETTAIFSNSKHNIVIPADIWNELSLMGHWIIDACILRWAELTEDISQGKIKSSRMLDTLLIKFDPERDVKKAKDFFGSLTEKECVWSGKTLNSKFDVDHAIPYSLWKNNDLWNLFPTNPEINNQKKDKLPNLNLLKDRKNCIINYWEMMRKNYPVQFDFEVCKFGGSSLFNNENNWQTHLFNKFSEAIEMTAIQRGSERWTPKESVKKIKNKKISALALKPKQFCEVQKEIYNSYLPIIGTVAAGKLYNGIELNNDHEAYEWLETPKEFIKKTNFILQVTGDSMEPLCSIGDFIVIEYHRRSRKNKQVVLMVDFNHLDSGELAIKRIFEKENKWHFKSENKKYEDIIIPKEADRESTPILGIVKYNLTKQEKIN